MGPGASLFFGLGQILALLPFESLARFLGGLVHPALASESGLGFIVTAGGAPAAFALVLRAAAALAARSFADLGSFALLLAAGLPALLLLALASPLLLLRLVWVLLLLAARLLLRGVLLLLLLRLAFALLLLAWSPRLLFLHPAFAVLRFPLVGHDGFLLLGGLVGKNRTR